MTRLGAWESDAQTPAAPLTAQRTREMALLRSIGTTPSQLRRMILMETSVLSVVVTALAVAPGYLLDPHRQRCPVPGDRLPPGLGPMLVGAATAVLAAAGATRFAGRKAARTEPVAALADSEAGPRWFTRNRLLLALFFLTVGISLSATTVLVMENGPTLASAVGPASVFFSIGIALLAPAPARPSACPAASPYATRPPTPSGWRAPPPPSSC
ncbi:ABC transporter permease [Streptomyces niveus]